MLLSAIKSSGTATEKIGEYRGFAIYSYFDTYSKEFKGFLQSETKHYLDFGMSELGNIMRIDNVLDEISTKLEIQKKNLERFKDELEKSKKEVQKPFAQAILLAEKRKRLNEVNKLVENGLTNGKTAKSEGQNENSEIIEDEQEDIQNFEDKKNPVNEILEKLENGEEIDFDKYILDDLKIEGNIDENINQNYLQEANEKW